MSPDDRITDRDLLRRHLCSFVSGSGVAQSKNGPVDAQQKRAVPETAAWREFCRRHHEELLLHLGECTTIDSWRLGALADAAWKRGRTTITRVFSAEEPIPETEISSWIADLAADAIDAELLQRWAFDRSVAAADELGRRWFPRLRRYFSSRWPGVTGVEIDDLCGQTIAKLLANAAKFESERSACSWIYSWAFGEGSHAARTDRRPTNRTFSLESGLSAKCGEVWELPAERDSDPRRRALLREAQARVRECVNHLEDIDRDALVLQMAGASLREIADALDKTVSGVKTLLYRARLKLRQRFGAELLQLFRDLPPDDGHYFRPGAG